MENTEPLAWYGTLVLIVTGCLVLIPYLRRQADLVSAWNILLLGIAIYVGLGCYEAVLSPMRFRHLDWFQPTDDEVQWYLKATTIFLVTLFATYYLKPFSRLTARSFNKWPTDSTASYLFVIGACFFIVALVPLTSSIVFIDKVTQNLSHKALIFATVFSFVLWLRNRLNMAWLALFIATFIASCLLAILHSPGRRLVLSVPAGPVLCLYMFYVRKWRPSRGMATIAVATVCLFVVALMYDTFRRFNRDPSKERTVANIVTEIKNVGERDWLGAFTSDALRMLCQEAVHYSLFTQRSVATGQLEAEPLNTVKFLVSYPIPRQIWPEKPKTLGGSIARATFARETSIVRWGCGMAGHAAYEGGLWVAALYAFFAAVGIRFFDDPLQRQPTNPYLIATLAAAAPHIVAWPRGDIGIMTIESLECFIFAIVMSIVCRVIFGTQHSAKAARAVPVGGRLAYQRFPH